MRDKEREPDQASPRGLGRTALLGLVLSLSNSAVAQEQTPEPSAPTETSPAPVIDESQVPEPWLVSITTSVYGDPFLAPYFCGYIIGNGVAMPDPNCDTPPVVGTVLPLPPRHILACQFLADRGYPCTPISKSEIESTPFSSLSKPLQQCVEGIREDHLEVSLGFAVIVAKAIHLSGVPPSDFLEVCRELTKADIRRIFVPQMFSVKLGEGGKIAEMVELWGAEL